MLSAAVAHVWSYEGSLWILGAFALMFAVWVVPFQLTGQPTATVDRIAWDWWPVRALYALIALSTAVCSWQRLRRDLRRLRRPLARPSAPSASALLLRGTSVDALAEDLRARGYEVARDESGLQAVRHRWSPLGGSLFHVALLVFAVAILLQRLTASTAEIRVTEGQPFAQAAQGEQEWARSAVDGLTLTAIQPSYYRDVLLFTGLDASLRAVDGRPLEMSLARPRWLDPFTHLSVQDYGLAPHIRTEDATGTVLEDAVVAMNIFPPGAEDSVRLSSAGVELSVVAYPDYGVVDGRDVSLSYNIRRPAFRLSARSFRDQSVLGRAIVRPGEPMKAGDKLVTITGLSRYGTFKVYRSYAPPLIALAGACMLIGLAMRFGWPRHDVVVWDTEDGPAADGWLDGFGRREGRHRLEAMAGGAG